MSLQIGALDLSLTDTGFCNPDGAVSSIAWAKVPKHKGKMTPQMIAELHIARLEAARTFVRGALPFADLVVMEGYSYASKDGKAFDRAEIRGAIRLSCALRNLPFVEVDPGTIKMFATGLGNAGKPLMMVEAVKRLGYEGSNENEVDALWLWHLTHQYLGTPQPHARLATRR